MARTLRNDTETRQIHKRANSERTFRCLQFVQTWAGLSWRDHINNSDNPPASSPSLEPHSRVAICISFVETREDVTTIYARHTQDAHERNIKL